MKTRVMIVSNTLAEGGAERWASFMACHLGFESFEIILVLFRRQIDYPCPDPVQVECLEHHSTLHTLRTVRRLRRLFAKTEPDVVISNGNYTAQFVGQAMRRSPLRWVARFSGNIEHCSVTLPQKWGWRWLDRNIRFANTLVANSEGVRDDIRHRWPAIDEKIMMVRNGVDIDQLREQTPRAPTTTPLVVGVGRLTRQKRPDLFVKAIKQLVVANNDDDTAQAFEKNSSRFRAVWCGDGPLRETIQHQIDDSGLSDVVELLGFRDDVHQWIARASCFVLTSDHEGSPNVLVESMALGTPVVSTDCPFGPKELIGDDRGWLVPVGDVAAIASALGGALSDPTAADQRADRALAWVKEHASNHHVIADWRGLLRRSVADATRVRPEVSRLSTGAV